MAGKISEMLDGGASQGTDRFEVTRDPTGTPLTRFQDLAGIAEFLGEQSAYAIMEVQAGSTAEATVDTTPRKIAAWNVDSLEQNMVVDSTTGNDITAVVAGTYVVASNVSFSGSSGDTFQFELFKNGVATGFAIDRKLGTGGDVGSMAIIGIIALVATDTLEVFQSTVDGNAITITEGQLFALRIGN